MSEHENEWAAIVKIESSGGRPYSGTRGVSKINTTIT
jgi:hypothetical protein